MLVARSACGVTGGEIVGECEEMVVQYYVRSKAY